MHLGFFLDKASQDWVRAVEVLGRRGGRKCGGGRLGADGLVGACGSGSGCRGQRSQEQLWPLVARACVMLLRCRGLRSVARGIVGCLIHLGLTAAGIMWSSWSLVLTAGGIGQASWSLVVTALGHQVK